MKSGKVGIIGGGPSGLYLAMLLAEKGVHTTVFDHKIPFEKACGGGITSKAFGRYPILDDLETITQTITEFEVISADKRTVSISENAHLKVVSRLKLSEYMLDKAINSGVIHISEKADGFRSENGKSILTAGGKEYAFDFVAGADGAHGISRRLFGAEAFNKSRYAAMGYYIEGLSTHKIVLKFYQDKQGYLWMFPRPGHASVGIAFLSGTMEKEDVLQLLDEFMAEHYPDFTIDPQQNYAATIPIVPRWRKENLQGTGWALIGDAGGFADPITGEGIYFAFETAALLAESIIENRPDTYFDKCAEIRAELEKAYDIIPRIYGGKTINRLVRIARRSERLRRSAAAYIMGYLSYRKMKQHVVTNSFKIGTEVVSSFFK